MNRSSLLSLLVPLMAVLGLAGCPTTGIVCKPGTVRCGDGCVDSVSDKRNCGGCGIACGDGQVCETGACKCGAGATSCAGACAVTEYDSQHCGSCTTVCTANQVCEAGACKDSCALGSSLRCGAACVNPSTDVNHCGDCSTVCPSGQSCRAGACAWDVVAACYSSGQVVGVQAGTELRGPLADLGSAPGALALAGNVLLSADGFDNRLYQASFPGLVKLDRANRTGAAPNQVLVDGDFVYVINSMSNTLQVLQKGGTSDAGDVVVFDGGAAAGLPLVTVAELPLGANTSPEGMAKLGDALWIPLYGGSGGAAAAAGQKVVRVSVANPLAPQLTDTVDLAALDLHPFDGGTPMARPWAIVAHRGALYVVLNNLNPDWSPGGPGLLARIDPATKQVTTVDLGADRCLNAYCLASDGVRLVVSCSGKPVYSPSWELLRTDKAGLVLLDEHDTRVATWAAGCPASAQLSDGGSTCAPVQPGRFAWTGARVYLADLNAGRLFVLDVGDAGFGERRGYAGDAGAPLAACPINPTTGFGYVADVVAAP